MVIAMICDGPAERNICLSKDCEGLRAGSIPNATNPCRRDRHQGSRPVNIFYRAIVSVGDTFYGATVISSRLFSSATRSWRPSSLLIRY
jgi:hypothetical protein